MSEKALTVMLFYKETVSGFAFNAEFLEKTILCLVVQSVETVICFLPQQVREP